MAPTSVSSGKWCPFATTCVPIRMSIACPSTAAMSSAAARGLVSVSLAMIARRAPGKRAVTSSASRSTPGPHGAKLEAAPHAGQSGGTRSLWPQ